MSVSLGTTTISTIYLGTTAVTAAYLGTTQVFGTSFSPSSLFASSEQGGWYDPSDLSTLWQDTAGTTAVTTDGQTVARIDDKSGRGNHLTQGTSGRRPAYKTSGGLHWLEFDGTDDCLFGAAATDMSSSDKVSIFAGLRRDQDATARMFVELSTNVNSFSGTFYVSAPETSSNRFGSTSRGNAAAVSGHLAILTVSTANDLAVITARHDIAGDSSKLYRNRTIGTDGTADKGTGNFNSTRALYLGARGDASLRFQGRMYGLIIRGGTSTSGEIADAEAWLATKTGVTL